MECRKAVLREKFRAINTAIEQETSKISNKQITSVSEDMEKREPSYTIGGNVNWCSHHGGQYGDFSKS